MPFASGYVLLAEGANAEAVAGELASMGFEVYYTDVPGKLVYYVESDDVEGLEALIRSAERVPGVIKAYVVYAFLGDREEAMRLEEALASGEVELDEETRRLVAMVLSRLKGGGRGSRP